MTIEKDVQEAQATASAEPAEVTETTETAEATEGITPEQQAQMDDAMRQFTEFMQDIQQTKTELEAARKEVEESETRYARLQADFDNFKRRTRQEKEDLARFASEQLIVQLLPVLDNFDRAVAAMEAQGAQNLVSGLAMIQRQVLDILSREGLQAMDAVGQPFDPNYHDAVMHEPANEAFPDGTVMMELQKGYVLKDKVIRPAMVKVAQD
ncbi:nucleotide exchange factor GrpE [Heliophilum fasciatum]|uniref:Protein GrpE n=1 Tax=Heliophilum fasciatum TaxID=35700 RepID=A0A4R2RND9_9FIRM|nr:nucleotide exchange factor GrpE [Heliophilum fasciatum]MCW2278129.1 molecular chaperone GrpE [Heliophilum fasciatum]TCP64199.1 molecular chaperone GrpE [Heliophilum fasciatum]